MASNFTVFSNDSGSASGAIDYVRDAFPDISLPATNNSGLTDNANTNPQNRLFANNNAPLFGAKTLFIKDLILESDRSKWINSMPTYRVITTEPYPNVNLYIFGDIQICANEVEVASTAAPFKSDCKLVEIKSVGGGIGVNGVIRRVAFMVNDLRTGSTGTGQVVTDGANGNTITFSGLATNSDDTKQTRFSMFTHSAANETNDLHDIRLTANEVSTLKIVGVVVLVENAGANIGANPGVTYVDKTKIATTVGATTAIPAMGSSFGGNVLIATTTSNGVQATAKSFLNTVSIAQGSSGTNLFSVSTGDGSSFPPGSGVISSRGSSMYVGMVNNVSTDTLTVSPTLSFGISNTIYRAWIASPTLAVNASFFVLANTIDFGARLKLQNGATGILDLKNSYNFWGKNIGATLVNNNITGVFLGASGFIQVDGDFQAADIEFLGTGTLHATMSVNGLPAWSQNAGASGVIKKTIFSEGPAGWNSFVLSPGASYTNGVGIQRISLYKRSNLSGITYGVLGNFNVHTPATERPAINATLMAIGTARRVYADQLYLTGSWVRGTTHTAPGGAFYYGASTNSVMQFQYYGKEFAVLGTPGGGTLSLDSVGIGLTFNSLRSVATLGFHTLQYTVASGSTAILQAVDFASPYGEMKNNQNVLKTSDQAAFDAGKVVAVYAISADVTIPDNTVYDANYDQRHIDSHHCVRTGVGVWSFTCPRSGIYDLGAGWVDSLQAGSVYNIQVFMRVNGITLYNEIRSGTTANTVLTSGVSGTWPVELFAGDVVTVQFFPKENGAGSHTVFSAGGQYCVFRAVER